MGNGCLKPTPRTGQIYIDCINKIYEEVKCLQQQQINNNNKQSIDLYVRIKQLLQKKGWLRKLMDNLTSHRESISQAALHNFRLMTQSKGRENKVAGLVVVDFIVSGVLRESGLGGDGDGDIEGKGIGMQMSRGNNNNNNNNNIGNSRDKDNKDKEINAQSQYEQSSENFNNNNKNNKAIDNNKNSNNPLSSKPLTPLTYTGSSSIHNNINSINNLNEQSNTTTIVINQYNSLTSNYNSNNINNNNTNNISMNSLLLREIYNVKFSNIFYNMLHSLLSTQDSLYIYAIKSIITYSRYHTVKNIQQQKITEIMQILLQHIQTNQQVNLSLKAYEMLLKKLRQTFLQNEIKHFNIFLRIWEHTYQLTNSQQQQSKDIHANLQNKFLLESIIHKMIVSMIGSVGINKIYEQIIVVYDQHRFQGMLSFQEMLINITRREQLKKQFYRGLYSFLLSYLAVCRVGGKGNNIGKGNNNGKQMMSQQNNNNRLQLVNKNSTNINKTNTNNNLLTTQQSTTSPTFTQKWQSIHSTKSYQSFIQQYEHILDYKVKKSVISTLKRWSRQYEFVQINEIIKYNSQLVLNSFLFNIHEAFVSEVSRGKNKDINKDGKGMAQSSISSSVVRQLPPLKLNNNNTKNSPSLNSQSYQNNAQKQFITFLVQEFCQQFAHHANLQQRITLINLLYDQIKTIDTNYYYNYNQSSQTQQQQQLQFKITNQQQQKLLYIQMIQKLLYEQQIQTINKHIDWCQIDIMYNKQLITKLINLMIIIVNKLTEKMLIKQLDNLAYFLYSLFDMFTKISVGNKEMVGLLAMGIKLIQAIERNNGSLIVLAFTQRMVKAVTNELDKTNFFYTWDFIINCTYILLTSPRNFNRQRTKSHLNQIYILMTRNQQLKNSVMKFTQPQIDQKVIKILIDVFGDMSDNQLDQQQIIKVDLPKVEDFDHHHQETGSHQKIYQLSSIAFRDMFNRGVSRAKGGFFPSPEEEVSFISQNGNGGGFSRANSIIHEDDVRHEERSIADVMDMIHY